MEFLKKYSETQELDVIKIFNANINEKYIMRDIPAEHSLKQIKI
jgi:hypothetical protein